MRLALACCLLLAGLGCARAKKPAPEAPAPVQRVLDYRNGWFHKASGIETVAAVAERYYRNAELVAELNQLGGESVPKPGTPIYVPPVNDRVAMREVLRWINEHPETVPAKPPPIEMLQRSPAVLPPPPELPQATDASLRAEEAKLAEAHRTRADKGPPLSAAPAIKAAAAGQGEFLWPITGEILKPFKPERPERFKGIAIAAPENARVHAARAGKVIFAGDLKGYGQAVIVDHGDGFSTVYGYASQLLVANNAEVAAGQEIAATGRPSRSAPSQLFFQIRRAGQPVDPMGYLGGK